jgi:hypothetical protein
MTRRVHFECEVLYGTLSQPLCENNAGRDAFADADKPVSMTDDESEVTCRRCLSAMGIEAAPREIEARYAETLTEVHGDPFKRRAA